MYGQMEKGVGEKDRDGSQRLDFLADKKGLFLFILFPLQKRLSIGGACFLSSKKFAPGKVKWMK